MLDLLLAAPLVLPVQDDPAGAPAPAPDLLVAVPEDAALVAVTDAFDAVRARSAENAWRRFLGDERFDATWAAIPTEQAFDELDFGWEDARSFVASIHGRAAFFLAPAGPEGRPAGGVLIEPGEPADAFFEAHDRMIAWAEEREDTIPSTDDYGEARLTILEEAESDETVVLFDLGVLVGATMAEDRETAMDAMYGVVDRWEGVSDSLGFRDSPLRREARGGAASAPALEVIALPLALEELFGEEDAPEPAEGPDEPGEGFVAEWGFDRIRWVHLGMDVDRGERLDLRVRALVPRDTLVGEVLGFLGPRPEALLAAIPRESLSVGLYRYDVAGLWDWFDRYLADRRPDAHDELQAGLAETVDGLGADPIQGLVRQLTGDFATFRVSVPREEVPMIEMMPADEVDESMLQGAATLIGLRDVEAVRTFLGRVLEGSGMAPMVTTEDFQGTPVHTLSMGPMALHWSFLPDHLAVSMLPTPLRGAVRAHGGDPAATAAEVERFAKPVGDMSDASVLSLTETASVVRQLLATVQMILGFAEMSGEELPPELARLEPPDPAMAEEYFDGTTVFALRRVGDVLELELGTR